ncbi:unnamed protein product [Phytophthora fragariaefolia]|uniref:Unnamed protein product n=1 Tax=Phytophthora fragariaefolia TaxID=1490495 RepID=A0A9W7CUN7_9STRA|nr:unnamed protein product [Phytophthora fragariaefolia]
MLARMIYWHKLDSTSWSQVGTTRRPRLFSKISTIVRRSGGELKVSRLDEAREIAEALFSDVGGGAFDDGDDVRDENFDPSFSEGGSSRRTTPPRAVKRRQSVTSDSGASIAGASGAPIMPPAKKRRPSQERTQSPLARKKDAQLTTDELHVIETPIRGVLSWRHHGVLMKFFPGTTRAVEQTTRFSDYHPNMSNPEVVEVVRERWDPDAMTKLYKTKPWDAMFDGRSKYLVLHSRTDVSSPFIQNALTKIVAAMKKHRHSFWLVGHWFFVPKERDAVTAELVRERKKVCDAAKNEYKQILDDLVDQGLPESFLEEPGV